MQKGQISVQTENIFPIIKKFLYSDQEIFLRELISNAVDATSKLKTLASKGVFKGDVGDTTIEVILDKENKTITISDKGIGMTSEEVQKYLNQVAFSSAQEFLDKYTQLVADHKQQLPAVQLRMTETETKHCFFVDPVFGIINEDRFK